MLFPPSLPQLEVTGGSGEKACGRQWPRRACRADGARTESESQSFRRIESTGLDFGRFIDGVLLLVVAFVMLGEPTFPPAFPPIRRTDMALVCTPKLF